MRLVAFFLGSLFGPVLLAQNPKGHPWLRVPALPWQSDPVGAPPEPLPALPIRGELQVELRPEGTLHTRDGRGLVRHRIGLPGRPLRVWRDGGTPLFPATGTWFFPARAPLQDFGLGLLLMVDLRAGLEGLLWVLEDGERTLTVILPATGRLVHLPLPPGLRLGLSFFPDRLGVYETATSEPQSEVAPCWSLPWALLLPRLLPLAEPQPQGRAGTALQPFPSGQP